MTDAAKLSRISNDTKWIIGTIVPAILVVAGLLSMQIAIVNAGLNARLDDTNARLERLEADARSLDARVRAVEITLGQVLQRLETLERVILPPEPAQ